MLNSNMWQSIIPHLQKPQYLREESEYCRPETKKFNQAGNFLARWYYRHAILRKRTKFLKNGSKSII